MLTLASNAHRQLGLAPPSSQASVASNPTHALNSESKSLLRAIIDSLSSVFSTCKSTFNRITFTAKHIKQANALISKISHITTQQLTTNLLGSNKQGAFKVQLNTLSSEVSIAKDNCDKPALKRLETALNTLKTTIDTAETAIFQDTPQLHQGTLSFHD
jgi:hypothetical protein